MAAAELRTAAADTRVAATPPLRRRLASGGAWSAAGRVVTAASTLAANALLARLLGADELGAYFLLSTAVMMAVSVAHTGLGQTGVRLISGSLAAGQQGRARAAILRLLAVGAVFAAALALPFGLGGGRWLAGTLFDSPAMAAAAALASLWLLAAVLQTVVAEAWRGCGDIRYATLFGGAITGLLAAGGLATCWALGLQPALSDALPLFIAAATVNLAVGGWLLVRRALVGLHGPGTVGVAEVARGAAPLLLAALPWLALSHADVLIVGAFQAPEEVARYATAARLMALVVMPLVIVNAVLPPVIAELYARGELHRLERMLRTTATLAGLPPVVALAAFGLFGEAVLGAVYGDAYRDGATVLAILSAGYLINVWSGSCGLTLMQTGQSTAVLAVALLGAATAIGLGLALVGPYGAEGVAAATAAGLATLNVGFWLAVRRRTGIRTHIELGRLLRPRAFLLELR